MDNYWMRKARWLTQALIISGALNVGFLATFVYFVLKEKQGSVAFELKPKDPNLAKNALTNEKTLCAYSLLSFQDLLARLDNKEHIEDGFTKRDIALGCLVAFHHFNLDRALGGLQLQQRKVSFDNLDGTERTQVTLYPGLADYQFQAIFHYAKTEKWPFTSQGLFYEIKRAQRPYDPALLETFFLTPEFHAIATLFNRSNLNLDKEVLIALLVQGEWRAISDFHEKQKIAQDLSPDRRRAFLLEYLDMRSPLAANLLLESDFEFACKRLDDSRILLVLDTLKEKSPALENFAKELISSPRSDAIWKKAAASLYTLANEPLPEPYDNNSALARFVPHAAPKPASIEPQKKAAVAAPQKTTAKSAPTKVATPTKNKPKRMHTVQQGENLWKIARKYRVPVDAIIQANRLDSEKLRPGKQLEIP